MYNSVNIERIILSKLALTLCRTTGIFYRFNIRYKLGQPREIILENEHLFLAVFGNDIIFVNPKILEI